MDGDDTRDPDAPPSAEESADAEALRDALAKAGPTGPARPKDLADFARAVSLAHAPPAIADADHRAIVSRAVERAVTRRAAVRRRAAWRTTLVAGGLALAAAVALWTRSPPGAESPESRASLEPLVPVRSTQPLFREPFAKTGGESARIDRIASARAADLRDNRFAAWGVR